MLRVDTLRKELLALGHDHPQGREQVAQAWFRASWAYLKEMEYLAEASLGVMEPLAREAFVPSLREGLSPRNHSALIFFRALEQAHRSLWLALDQPQFFQQGLSIIPAPMELAGPAERAVRGREKDTTPDTSRRLLAQEIDKWTRTYMILMPSPASPLPFL